MLCATRGFFRRPASRILPSIAGSWRQSGNTCPRGGESWDVDRVRSTFISYFNENHGHSHVPSSSVVPYKDNSIIFANAGMNQFKAIFTGTVEPTNPFASLERAVNSQKCIRAGGKHNDLTDVGKDVYHHTFFEMLGTWSFGNYFKEDSIKWAYDLLVNVYGLPKEQLYVSYFQGDASLGIPCDEEVKNIWLRYLPPERVLPFGLKENFWEMGDVGPCGPASEIHFDRIGGRDAAHLVNADDPDVLEIWNLVYMQYNREIDGALKSLPQNHVDTGMGLERLTSILQGTHSNYDTDVFSSLFKEIHANVGGTPYLGYVGGADARNGFRDMAFRVLADHARTLTFAITDGAVPSNEGRGYVLRRILRRAFRYARQNLDSPPGLLLRLVPVVANNYSSLYPELANAVPKVLDVISEEETSFSSMLERGITYFKDIAADIKRSSGCGQQILAGENIFFMYDTLGFPPDLTELMAEEEGIVVDMAGFNRAMELQRTRSREAEMARRLSLLRGKKGGANNLLLSGEHIAELQRKGIAPTVDDAKYELDDCITTTIIEQILTPQGNLVDSIELHQTDGELMFGILLSATSFYAESGGQVGDTGKIVLSSKNRGDGNLVVQLQVLDTQVYGGYVLHICAYEDALLGDLKIQARDIVDTVVDANRRGTIAPKHTMMHLLNHALVEVLGASVYQHGSLVTDEKLRFDFNSAGPLSHEEIRKVEHGINRAIGEKLPVYSSVVPLDKALKVNGIKAVFGETYPDPVRMVSIGVPVQALLADPDNGNWRSFSIELCGGTHINNCSLAEALVITEESGIAKGIRRVSAVVGRDALDAIRNGEDTERLLREVFEKVTMLIDSHTMTIDDIESVEHDLRTLRYALDRFVLPIVKKHDISKTYESLASIFKRAVNEVVLQKAESEITKCVAGIVSHNVASPYVGSVLLPSETGNINAVVKRVTEDIKKNAPKLSFMLFFSSKGSDKILCVANVSASNSKQFNATEWVRRTIRPYGGKGGGRADTAQGSLLRSSVIEKTVPGSMSSATDGSISAGMPTSDVVELLCAAALHHTY